MNKATLLNMLDANRKLFMRVVSQVGEFRMLESMGKDHQTGKDTRYRVKPHVATSLGNLDRRKEIGEI
jgi:hypothetical protein